MYVCKECGGNNVEIAAWVDPNDYEYIEDFGSWDNGDNTWCEDCKAHNELVELQTEKERAHGT